MSAQDFLSASDSDILIDTTPVVDQEIEESKLLKLLPEFSCTDIVFVNIKNVMGSEPTVHCSTNKGKTTYGFHCNQSMILNQKTIVSLANSNSPLVPEFVDFYGKKVEELFEPFKANKYDRTLMAFVIYLAALNVERIPGVFVPKVKNNLFALRNTNALVPYYPLYKEICKQVGLKEFIPISKPAKAQKAKAPVPAKAPAKAPVKTSVKTPTVKNCRNCGLSFDGEFITHNQTCSNKKEQQPRTATKPCFNCGVAHFPFCKKGDVAPVVES